MTEGVDGRRMCLKYWKVLYVLEIVMFVLLGVEARGDSYKSHHRLRK